MCRKFILKHTRYQPFELLHLGLKEKKYECDNILVKRESILRFKSSYIYIKSNSVAFFCCKKYLT